jgi:hypothetical protein
MQTLREFFQLVNEYPGTSFVAALILAGIIGKVLDR